MLLKLLNIKRILQLINYWPPYLGTGIRVVDYDKAITKIKVQMKQRFYNSNYVASHFGGSLYSMCDPWYMFILLHHLGKDFIVWDKGASIDYKKPARGTVTAVFKIPLANIHQVKEQALQQGKATPVFETSIYNAQNQIVAQVQKTLYLKPKALLEKK